MIPVCEPSLIGNEEKYVIDVVRSGWVSSAGRYIKDFEEGFSRFCGVKYGVSCSSGTTALHLALRALDIREGNEVIVPNFSIIAVPNSVVYCGATPVLVDAERETWNIDPEKIEDRISSKTKAIMAVHTYGHPCEMKPILEIAKKYGLKVVEDCAEAHGAEYRGRKVGSFGNINCFSYYGNKILTAGEGGMVVTNDKDLAERVRNLKDQAQSEVRFLHKDFGYNYRMTNVQAAIGLAQLENIDELIERRRRNARSYNSLLQNVHGLTLPVERRNARNVYWMYGILVEDDFGISKEEVMQRLKEKGIDTRSFFYGIHSQPIYKQTGKAKGLAERYPVSEELTRKGLYLPSSGNLTEEQREYVVQSIKNIA